jgi:hypothetical protein
MYWCIVPNLIDFFTAEPYNRGLYRHNQVHLRNGSLCPKLIALKLTAWC